MALPSTDQIVFPKLGNLLMPIVSSAGTDTNSIEYKFNQLYNGDACALAFSNKYDEQYDDCVQYWNGIITKGMEQAMTQMSVSISSVLDDLKNLNDPTSNYTLKNCFNSDSNYYKYEEFVEYYFYNSFLETTAMFDILRNEKVTEIKSKFDILLYLYVVVSVLLFFFILFFIYSIKSDFNSFLSYLIN